MSEIQNWWALQALLGICKDEYGLRKFALVVEDDTKSPWLNVDVIEKMPYTYNSSFYDVRPIRKYSIWKSTGKIYGVALWGEADEDPFDSIEAAQEDLRSKIRS